MIDRRRKPGPRAPGSRLNGSRSPGSRPTGSRFKGSRPNGLILLVTLLALGLRLIYAPLHLAQEEHLGSVGHATFHGAHAPHPDHEHSGEHGHDSEHEHDEDHEPHSALDHGTDLIVQRTTRLIGQSTRAVCAALVAVPLELGAATLGRPEQRHAPTGAPPVPKSKERRTPPERGPPAAV